tara:strand:- start:114 stop:401 length:288 start_codon:yes stop_codon:yes gene_type:complete
MKKNTTGTIKVDRDCEKKHTEINIPSIPKYIGFLEYLKGPVCTSFSGSPSGTYVVSNLFNSMNEKIIIASDEESTKRPKTKLIAIGIGIVDKRIN